MINHVETKEGLSNSGIAMVRSDGFVPEPEYGRSFAIREIHV